MLFRGDILIGYDLDSEQEDFDRMIASGELVPDKNSIHFRLNPKDIDKQPIKVVFKDRFKTELLPNNTIKFSESITSNEPIGYITVSDDEWESVKQKCEELGIEIID